MYRFLFTLSLSATLTLIFTPHLFAERPGNYPDYVAIRSLTTPDTVPEISEASLVPIIYKVNRYELITNSSLDSICATLKEVAVDPRLELSYICVGGSASPEGPLWWNKKLGHYRSTALTRYLVENNIVDSKLIKTINLEEDWHSTEKYLKAHPEFPHSTRILDIIASEPNCEKRKLLIKNIDDWATWNKLIAEVFPPFRNARLTIECRYIPRMRIPNADITRALLPQGIAMVKPTIVPGYEVPYYYYEQRRQRFVAFKTNLLFVAALSANLAVETELWEGWSLDIPVWYSPYDITKKLRLRLLATQPELRWWTCGNAGEGWFVGAHTHIVGFNVSMPKTSRFQDPNHALWGVGISGGWAKNFGSKKQWVAEFSLGFGYAEYKWDTYRNWNNGPKYDSGQNHYLGLTKAGISIGYKWHFDRKPKRKEAMR